MLLLTFVLALFLFQFFTSLLAGDSSDSCFDVLRIRGGGGVHSKTQRRERRRKQRSKATTPEQSSRSGTRKKKRCRKQGQHDSLTSQSNIAMSPLSRFGHGSFMEFMEPTKVQLQWEQAITYDCNFVDPTTAKNKATYMFIFDSNNSAIEHQKNMARRGDLNVPVIDFRPFRNASKDEQITLEATFRFEVSQYKVKNRRCKTCHGVFLDNQFDTVSGKQCRSCSKVGNRYSASNNVQPIWYDEYGEVQWHVPDELKGLRIGEQMLIQRYSPYVPLVHIKNGTFGCTGHVCCFPQDLGEVCHVFPRLPTDVKVVKMVRHYIDGEGDEETQIYKVRREKVLTALHWLKKHHKEYANDPDLVIDECNLDWMGNKQEADLKGLISLEATTEKASDESADECIGVSEEQTSMARGIHDPNMFDVSGVVEENAYTQTNDNDNETIQLLKEASASNTQERVNWPQTSRIAIDEYRNNVFVNAFPWLYPGGIGDICDQHPEQHIEESQWARTQLRYFDGRFQKDPMWCFYALNFVQRHRNKKSGGFFLKDFVTNKPATLSELIERIEKGDTSFIDQLQYFSGKLEGSDAYWRKMKAELYSWINHHVEKGNGPPSLFMTLSCAEYFWADLQRLIDERCQFRGNHGEILQRQMCFAIMLVILHNLLHHS